MPKWLSWISRNAIGETKQKVKGEYMSDAIKVLIEIPEGSRVKYELDEDTNQIEVDRLMPTAMGYPVN